MENLGEQVLIIIEEIAVKMGVAAEHVYPLMLRQARIDGIFGIIVILMPLIIFFGFLKVIGKIVEKDDSDSDSSLLICTFGLTLSGLMFLITLFNISKIATALFNPEWYVIAELAAKLLK